MTSLCCCDCHGRQGVKLQRTLIICAKYLVNRMKGVKSRVKPYVSMEYFFSQPAARKCGSESLESLITP